MTDAIRYIFADQLTRDVAALQGIDKDKDIVLMAEVWDEATYVRHHPKKIALLFSAMRHFAQKLREDGITVDYVELDDHGRGSSFKRELKLAINRHDPDRVITTFPGEQRVLADMQTWGDEFGLPVEIRDDDRFLSTLTEYREWRSGYKEPKMEYFYRMMRKKYDILMDENNKPEGGDWNYDQDNRKSLPEGKPSPDPSKFEPDEITQAVLTLVNDRFDDHFGDLEPFYFAVTRDQALQALDDFITDRLENFGPYQDAIGVGRDFLWHSHLSAYLNCGLLTPLEVIERAEEAYYTGRAPINSVEGFIRQILGWREYIRHIYWDNMPGYDQMNALNAENHLPEFFWTGETNMKCVSDVVRGVRQHAYSHHIQRLMVTGNWALLAGIHPDEINEWYMIVHADAYQWAELPNVSGMAIYADGGILGTKPYCSSGKYINRQSNYCSNCEYDVNKSYGEDACPFNYLYWDFLNRHKEKLSDNRRMALIYSSLDRMGEDKKQKMFASARKYLNDVCPDNYLDYRE
jgi:deoxyribodipyrimidine photolyase-related protein